MREEPKQDADQHPAQPAQRPRRARRATTGLDDLTMEEIHSACAGRYQPIITLKEAAEIARCSPSTIKTRMSRHGAFKNSAKRGKPVLFFRDRFVKEVMGG